MAPNANNRPGKKNSDSGAKDNASRNHAAAHIAAVPAVSREGWLATRSFSEGWMEKIKARQQPLRTVTANEITSLSALIAYAANKSGTSEFRIERDLADRFHVANVTCLPASRFDDAMRYLVDRVPV